MIKWTATKNY